MNVQVYNFKNNYNGINLESKDRISKKESTLFDETELDQVIVVNINSDKKRINKDRNHHFISNS